MTEPLAFWADLVAALSELVDVVVDETANTGSYQYRYASLPQVMRAVRPVLAKHGLAVSQDVSTHDDCVWVTTRLVHRSGETFVTGPVGMAYKPDPQHLGSLVTYLRRYALVAVLGLGIEDDDGAAAKPPAKRSGPRARISKAQGEQIAALFSELGVEDREHRFELITAVLGRPVSVADDLSPADGDRVIDGLRRRLA